MTEDTKVEVSQDEALTKKLIRQVEFYFGDFNLHRDKFMQQKMQANDGWFSMDVMLQFQRLSTLCSEPGVILAALAQSKSGLLEVDVENLQIRRNPKRPVPANDAKYMRDLKLRTVHVDGFPQEETIEDLTDFLEDYGKVDGVKLCRFNKDDNKPNSFKGNLFVTYSKLEEAERFIQAPMVYYKNKPLEKKSKADFYKDKESLVKAKKSKKESESVDEVSYLLVSNIEDDTVSHHHFKTLWEELGAPSFKFFYKFEKNGPDAYIVTSTKQDAEDALKILQEKKNGVVSINSSTKISIEAMPADKLAAAVESYAGQRAKFLTKKGSKGNKAGGFKGRNKKRNQHLTFDNDGEPVTKQTKKE